MTWVLSHSWSAAPPGLPEGHWRSLRVYFDLEPRSVVGKVCLPPGPRPGVELDMSCGRIGRRVTNAGYTAWTCLIVHFFLFFLMLGSQPFSLDLFYLALSLSLSTGQMDDVLDYICTFHHSRDIYRHLPLLVSYSRNWDLSGEDVASCQWKDGKGLKAVPNLTSEQKSKCRMLTAIFLRN